MIRSAFFLALTAALCAACRTSPDTPPATAPDASAVSTATDDPAARFLAREPGALVVDVRTPAEFAGGHVAGARHIDVNEGGFAARLDSVDRARPVYLYCRTGNRSGRAQEALEAAGFTNVVNAGGFEALRAAGAATE